MESWRPHYVDVGVVGVHVEKQGGYKDITTNPAAPPINRVLPFLVAHIFKPFVQQTEGVTSGTGNQTWYVVVHF